MTVKFDSAKVKRTLQKYKYDEQKNPINLKKAPRGQGVYHLCAWVAALFWRAFE